MLWGPSSRRLHARTPRGNLQSVAIRGNPWQSVAISGAYPAGPAGVGSPWATAASESISSVISRIAQPPPIVTASSPSTRSPPMSVLIDASIGSVMPLPDRPSPWPGFHPIYEVRASTIRGHQRQSEAIRGHQRPSAHLLEEGEPAPRVNQWQSESISGNQSQSVAISAPSRGGRARAQSPRGAASHSRGRPWLPWAPGRRTAGCRRCPR